MHNSIFPIVLLVLSNVFMKFAWYGHLKFKGVGLPIVILVSWGIAFFEYCLQVPANRIGSDFYKPAELKTIQEVISLSVFLVFSVAYLDAPVKWNYVAGFVLMCAGAFFVFHEWG
jgi:uncharacterized protein (DUF486 family)